MRCRGQPADGLVVSVAVQRPFPCAPLSSRSCSSLALPHPPGPTLRPSGPDRRSGRGAVQHLRLVSDRGGRTSRAGRPEDDRGQPGVADRGGAPLPPHPVLAWRRSGRRQPAACSRPRRRHGAQRPDRGDAGPWQCRAAPRGPAATDTQGAGGGLAARAAAKGGAGRPPPPPRVSLRTTRRWRYILAEAKRQRPPSTISITVNGYVRAYGAKSLVMAAGPPPPPTPDPAPPSL